MSFRSTGIIAVTHGKKMAGPDPRLDPDGIEQIRILQGRVGFPDEFLVVMIGTGRRFMDTAVALDFNPGSSHLRCSLLGTADSGEKNLRGGMDVLLADGTPVSFPQDYIGLVGTPGIDLWAWLASLSADRSYLLVAGREFIGALLGNVNLAKSATAYEIDVVGRTVTEL